MSEQQKLPADDGDGKRPRGTPPDYTGQHGSNQQAPIGD